MDEPLADAQRHIRCFCGQYYLGPQTGLGDEPIKCVEVVLDRQDGDVAEAGLERILAQGVWAHNRASPSRWLQAAVAPNQS